MRSAGRRTMSCYIGRFAAPEAEMNDWMRDFLRDHNIHEVECVIADMTGIARGKILPKDLFLGGESMRLPKSVLLNTVNGGSRWRW